MLRHQDTQSQRMSLCISSAFANGAKIYFPCQNYSLPTPVLLPSIPQPMQAPSSKNVSCQGVREVHLGMEDLTPRSYRRSMTF